MPAKTKPAIRIRGWCTLVRSRRPGICLQSGSIVVIGIISNGRTPDGRKLRYQERSSRQRWKSLPFPYLLFRRRLRLVSRCRIISEQRSDRAFQVRPLQSVYKLRSIECEESQGGEWTEQGSSLIMGDEAGARYVLHSAPGRTGGQLWLRFNITRKVKLATILTSPERSNLLPSVRGGLAVRARERKEAN